MVPKLATKDAIQAEELALLPEIQDQIRIGQKTRSGEYELGTGPVASFSCGSEAISYVSINNFPNSGES